MSKSNSSTKTGKDYGFFYKDGGEIRGPWNGLLLSKREVKSYTKEVKSKLKRTPIIAKVNWTADIKG